MSRIAPKRGKRGNGAEGGPPTHPLARAIEQLYAAGTTPRLVIDARRTDVAVPDFLRAKWAEQLVIDLDAAHPLDLAYDDAGLHATLAFSGIVTRCTFAWASIYRVIDRATGRGLVVPGHEPPAELPPDLAYGSTQVVTEISAAVVRGADPAPSRRPGPLAAVPAEAPKLDAPSSSKADEPVLSASDAEAKARRAKFRVIEGG